MAQTDLASKTHKQVKANYRTGNQCDLRGQAIMERVGNEQWQGKHYDSQ